MKKNILTLIVTLVLGMGSVFATSAKAPSSATAVSANKKATFKVYGNCNMCKKNIEGSLKGVKGVKSANWDVKSKIMTVEYNEASITDKEIQNKIAGVGYDTEQVKGNDAAYNKLHQCCQYDRKK